FHNTSAISAMPMGAPGWPELAFWTASMLRARMALARSLRSVRSVQAVRGGTRLDIRWRLLSEGEKAASAKAAYFPAQPVNMLLGEGFILTSQGDSDVRASHCRSISNYFDIDFTNC